MDEISPLLRPAWNYARKNPHIGLAALLFAIGVVALPTKLAIISGALFGAGASLLGAWINELNTRRSRSEEKARNEVDARKYLAAELNRTIERVLYIHSRAIPNFICVSAENGIKPNDLQEDFLPEMPVLYPNAPQFRDLSGDDATALINFYDSLHALDSFVDGWWEREGQLPVNIFNQVLHLSEKSLTLGLVCIERFSLETLYPPQYESWGTLTSRIERSLSFAKEAREHHIARFEAKNGKSGETATSRSTAGRGGPAQRGRPR
ncbi:hypothetical protein EOS_31955 [Caballeronia mineralivorans PML1(12)]|uniref:Uncharacterized protein n=1 Tax=Caballeronia mineralivorans PML1(12) TaxID=908627 RepID=A0A0J1FR00_9BURK|nr:hypothetical protein [Caballeronia mineralivorans]KLU22168.1 hypothetical protein EOS_31955 [Caballeronia mineralivorans PML1(12)]